MADLLAIAERDGWRCWLCDEPVPTRSRPGDPNAATVDHVVPRSKGGHGRPDNLRLAHRRCNNQRSSAAPTLRWPERHAVVDAPDLWQALHRLARRPGTSEVVALVPLAHAAGAAGWVEARAVALMGGAWSASVDELGPLGAVRLRAAPGAPTTPRAGRRRHRR